MHFVQLFIFIILKSSFISFSHPIFGIPANLVDIDLALLLVNTLDQEKMILSLLIQGATQKFLDELF